MRVKEVQKKGNVFGMLGANGGGKTSLFKMMVGLEQTTAGEIHIFGKDASKDIA